MVRRTSGTGRGLIITLLVLVLLLVGALGGMIWFVNSHFFVDGKAYPKDAELLNLRGEEVSVAGYEAIRAKLPDAEILWDVPFQNGSYPDDTERLTIHSLTQKELEVLAYFPRLREVDASGCRDYENLMALKARYPQVSLTYSVTIGGQEYPWNATEVTASELTEEDITMMGYLPELQKVDASGCREYSRIGALSEALPGLEISYRVEMLGQTFTEETATAIFRDPDVNVLMTELTYLPHMETVHLEEPSASADSLLALMEAYPDIRFTWNKTVLGKTFSTEDTEIDFSGMSFDSTAPVEAAMKYFPNAEKVIMSDCGIDNETMAAFREKMRSEYKVVWTVYITKKPVRTDATVIHSSALKVCFIDELSRDLKYCEDAVVVDIGHSYVKYIDWVEYMPNLKYLILTHNWIKDLTPISTCKNLVYLEIYWNEHIPDYTPLLGCTALKDLNLSGTYADPEPLTQMTWLDNLWATQTGLTAAEERMLMEALPNTTIKFGAIDYAAGGWRQVPGYFEMRDIMGLPYNTW